MLARSTIYIVETWIVRNSGYGDPYARTEYDHNATEYKKRADAEDHYKRLKATLREGDRYIARARLRRKTVSELDAFDSLDLTLARARK